MLFRATVLTRQTADHILHIADHIPHIADRGSPTRMHQTRFSRTPHKRLCDMPSCTWRYLIPARVKIPLDRHPVRRARRAPTLLAPITLSGASRLHASTTRAHRICNFISSSQMLNLYLFEVDRFVADASSHSNTIPGYQFPDSLPKVFCWLKCCAIDRCSGLVCYFEDYVPTMNCSRRIAHCSIQNV